LPPIGGAASLVLMASRRAGQTPDDYVITPFQKGAEQTPDDCVITPFQKESTEKVKQQMNKIIKKNQVKSH
jgi:hypothetical protein